ncbi:type II toxin-antitoxin system HicA family toxin [Candidatus Poribacteria bacterium]|nr:type II toxin-antitoxin system HicA family toxin [Candidatus Poribacteria bacterium]
MNPRFPAVRYRDVVKVLRKLGFEFYRQAKGSHEVWRRRQECNVNLLKCYGV